jgi:hypothetical protein
VFTALADTHGKLVREYVDAPQPYQDAGRVAHVQREQARSNPVIKRVLNVKLPCFKNHSQNLMARHTLHEKRQPVSLGAVN